MKILFTKIRLITCLGVCHSPKTILLLGFCCFHSAFLFAQTRDSTNVNKLDTVLVSAIRISDKNAVPYSNMSREELRDRNLGQDIPVLLGFLPSVVSTTDGGSGVGYSSIRVRGSDITRINVTANGIPLNDSESASVFWVNMPDFVSSVQSLQLQRGVGTSTNGAVAFGASLNMLTDSYSDKAYGEVSTSFGSFDTSKSSAKFGTGLLGKHFEVAGRLSYLVSNGYIDRASADMKSYFLQTTYIRGSTLMKALTFGGKQKTYQAWYGIDKETLERDRTYNPAGMFRDEAGGINFYENQTDNYQQNHYQLHWSECVTKKLTSNIALHYTKGKGYYESYQEDAAAADYGLMETQAEKTTDLVERKWLDNDFYGTTFSVNYKEKKLGFIFGGGYNKYDGDHYDEVIWAQKPLEFASTNRFYEANGVKTDGNLFLKASYQLMKNLNVYVDTQMRFVYYKTAGPKTGDVNDVFNFFNPKAGVIYMVNERNNLYFSFAQANREPNRTDYENSATPKPEKLQDYELGWRFLGKAAININAFYMYYKNQLVLTGALDDVGNPIRKNGGDSYRAGIEIDANLKIGTQIEIVPTISAISSRNSDFYSQKDGELVNLGKTNIAFSPNLVAGNKLVFLPMKDLQISLFSKFVSEQYMGNTDSAVSKLDSYFVNDLSVAHEIKTKTIFDTIRLNVLINNIFNEKYESNGSYYTYDIENLESGTTTVEETRYYPQAGVNILAGITILF